MRGLLTNQPLFALRFHFSTLSLLFRALLILYPQTSLLQSMCVCVCLQVISGSNLPSSRSGKTLDPFVRVEIHGIPSDSCKKTTHTDKNNGEWSSVSVLACD